MKGVFTKSLSILNSKERKLFKILIIFDVFISIADIIFLALLLFVIHFYTKEVTLNKFYFLPTGLFDHDSLLLITLFFILFSLKNFAGFLIYRSQCKFVSQVASRISQNKLLDYLEEETYSNYINIDSAVQIRKISYDPIEFSQHILGGIQEIITQFVLIFLTIIAILIFDAKLFILLFLILLPPVIVIFYFIKKRLRFVRTHTKVSSEKSLQYLQESLSGFVEINIYNKNRFFLDRYIFYQSRFNKNISDSLIIQGIPSRTIEIFALLGLFILIAINKWSIGNSTTIIAVGAFMIAAYKIIPGIVKILNIIGKINTYKFTIYSILQTCKRVNKKNNLNNLKNIHSLQFNNVQFSYDKKLILKDLSFNIKTGDFIGISGHSGKGKTTILNLLLGFLMPNSGSIIINDILTDIDIRKQYWKNIAYVKQQSFLIHDSIVNNIILDNSYNEQKLQEAIQSAGLSEFTNLFPEGVHHIITEGGKSISGGQRQRLAIARALYKDADLIILDEPFNELDEQSEIILLNHFKYLAKNGKIIILITHHQKSFTFCNKIISLDEQQ